MDGKTPDEVIRHIMAQAVFHTCFDCKRRFGNDELITITNVGPMIFYHHTAHMFDEATVQEIKEATREGEVVRADDFKEGIDEHK
jgi:hypothetical protein